MPQIFTGLACRYIPSLTEPILDVGAGTGILGQSLSLLGYKNIEALDYSKGMLEVCRTKGVYTAFHQLDIHAALPLADHRYSAVLLMGLFGKGPAPEGTLRKLSRVTAAGGCLIFSIREDEYLPGGYKGVQERLESSGTWERLYGSETFNSIPFDPTPILNRVLCFRLR